MDIFYIPIFTKMCQFDMLCKIYEFMVIVFKNLKMRQIDVFRKLSVNKHTHDLSI